MKRILLVLAFALPFLSVAQDSDLSGKWREVARIDLAGNVMDMRDTIKIDFLTGQEYTWLKKGGFIYRGTYKIENGALDMGSRYFSIVDMSPNRLVIKDEGATYEFMPYTEPPRARLPREAASAPVSDIRQLAGRWKVFKGTSSRTMKEIDYTTKVKSVMIFDAPDTDGNIGHVSAGKDPEGRPSWKINRYENGILYTNGKSIRLFEVIKADTKELILKEGPMTYFLKQFTE
jgi:hypothetical protein